MPGPDVRQRRAAPGSLHDSSGWTEQEVRRLPRRRRRELRGPAREGDRVPRPQRRRQDDDDADHGRALHAQQWPGHHRRAPVRRHPQPRPARRGPPRRLGPARRAHGPGGAHRRRRDDGAAPVPGGGDAGPGLAERVGGEAPPGRLLPGHAPAPGHCPGPAGRPRGADPRRAGQRPGPGGHPLDAQPAQGLRRSRRGGAALESPVARGPAGRRRHRDDRPGQDRGPGHPRRPGQGRRRLCRGRRVRPIGGGALQRGAGPRPPGGPGSGSRPRRCRSASWPPPSGSPWWSSVPPTEDSRIASSS